MIACATEVSWYSSSSTTLNFSRSATPTSGCSEASRAPSSIWSEKSMSPRSDLSRRYAATSPSSSPRRSIALTASAIGER